MLRLVLLALAALAPATALATVPPLPGSTAKFTIVSFAPPPARVSCEGREVAVVESAPIHPKAWQPWVPPVGPTPAHNLPKPSQSFTFSVNSEGAVTDLKPGGGFAPWPSDEQTAAIATWRFAPGAPATGCKLDLSPTQTALADTAPAKLFELLAFEGRNTPAAVREALAQAGDCDRAPRRMPDTIAYPDLRAFNDRSRSPSWVGVRYGIDAEGAVREVRIVAREGDAAFADTAASTVAESRFRPGAPRTGCFAVFTARPKTTPAPGKPDLKSFKRPGDACEISQKALNLPENKVFPPAYAARGVAGWRSCASTSRLGV